MRRATALSAISHPVALFRLLDFLCRRATEFIRSMPGGWRIWGHSSSRRKEANSPSTSGLNGNFATDGARSSQQIAATRASLRRRLPIRARLTDAVDEALMGGPAAAVVERHYSFFPRPAIWPAFPALSPQSQTKRQPPGLRIYRNVRRFTHSDECHWRGPGD